mmetsp:Transcript_509/g.1969  ORF Transcript_509/g.1969 Transcript_509/m.1969 type:complete len:337 (+) Transcript_509:1520-2530(+)
MDWQSSRAHARRRRGSGAGCADDRVGRRAFDRTPQRPPCEPGRRQHSRTPMHRVPASAALRRHDLLDRLLLHLALQPLSESRRALHAHLQTLASRPAAPPRPRRLDARARIDPRSQIAASLRVPQTAEWTTAKSAARRRWTPAGEEKGAGRPGSGSSYDLAARLPPMQPTPLCGKGRVWRGATRHSKRMMRPELLQQLQKLPCRRCASPRSSFENAQRRCSLAEEPRTACGCRERPRPNTPGAAQNRAGKPAGRARRHVDAQEARPLLPWKAKQPCSPCRQTSTRMATAGGCREGWARCECPWCHCLGRQTACRLGAAGLLELPSRRPARSLQICA